MSKALRLGQLLSEVTQFDVAGFLYLPMDEIWELETRCAVISHSDMDNAPSNIEEHGFSYALEIASVQDVVENAHNQIRQPTQQQLLQAFLYYYDHDAFIVYE